MRINGTTHYLWRAVDHEGEVLEFMSQNGGIAGLRLIYRKYKNSFPGGLSPESGIVVQAR